MLPPEKQSLIQSGGWVGEGEAGNTLLMLCLPSHASQFPLHVPFVESYLRHSPTDPLLLWGDVNVTVCQDLAWCYQMGAQPGS